MPDGVGSPDGGEAEGEADRRVEGVGLAEADVADRVASGDESAVGREDFEASWETDGATSVGEMRLGRPPTPMSVPGTAGSLTAWPPPSPISSTAPVSSVPMATRATQTPSSILGRAGAAR